MPKRLNPDTMPSAAWEMTVGGYQLGERCDVVTATQQSAEGAVPVVWCHGFSLGPQPAALATTSPYRQLLAAIASRGHVVLSADLAGGSTWGNDTALDRVDTLLDWAAANLGTRTDRVGMAGESMGSLLAQAWAWRHPQRVAALWVRAPLTALDAFHGRDEVFAPLIEAAYGGLAGYGAALPTHDPAQNRGTLAALGHVTRVDYTVDDELFPYGEVTDHVMAVGPDEAHVWAGDHAANEQTDPWAVADWVHRTIRRIAT